MPLLFVGTLIFAGPVPRHHPPRQQKECYLPRPSVLTWWHRYRNNDGKISAPSLLGNLRPTKRSDLPGTPQNCSPVHLPLPSHFQLSQHPSFPSLDGPVQLPWHGANTNQLTDSLRLQPRHPHFPPPSQPISSSRRSHSIHRVVHFMGQCGYHGAAQFFINQAKHTHAAVQQTRSSWIRSEHKRPHRCFT